MNKNKVKKQIDSANYASQNAKAVKQYSIFSTLGFLNRNTDLHKFTKNTFASALKSIYTAEQINAIASNTHSTSFEDLVKKVRNGFYGKNNQVGVKDVVNDVRKFLNLVQKEQLTDDSVKNYDKNLTESPVADYNNSPSSLVENVSLVYGENRYYNESVPVIIDKMMPLYTKFDNDDEGLKKLNQIENYIQKTYGYKLSYGTQFKKFGKTIKTESYNDKMSNAVNMLYSVSKTLVGSKFPNKPFAKYKFLKEAKNTLENKQTNTFLNAQGISNRNRAKILNNHSSEILDVVNSLTTIFMARFVFDSPYFAKIERDLSEQVAVKMQNLIFATNSSEDYFVNELIQDRVKVNCAQILSANNITNANQLLKIYNKNGTKVVNPEEIINLDDLIFSLQYNNEEKIENKELKNVIKNNIETKPLIKSENKVVSKKQKTEKDTKYLNKIRETELYKKYFAMYTEELNKAKLFAESEQARNDVEKIREESEENLNKLALIASNENLTSNVKDGLAKQVARQDSIINKCDELLNESEEVSEEEQTLENENTQNESEEKTLAQNEKTENSEEVHQQTIDDVLNSKETSNDIKEIEEESSKEIKYTTERYVKSLASSNEKLLEKRVERYYSNLINGKNGKPGIVGKLLNYRVIDKPVAKKNKSANDVERLDDKEFNKANKIRDEKIGEIITSLTEDTMEYIKQNSDKLDDKLTVCKACLDTFKNGLGIKEDEQFTRAQMSQFLSVYITKQVNEELKEQNLELYTGKKTFKKYNEFIEKLENN